MERAGSRHSPNFCCSKGKTGEQHHRVEIFLVACSRVGVAACRQELSQSCSNYYNGLPSRSAQALATAAFGVSLPGIVAQPPFSMIAPRSRDVGTLPNAASFAGASACCWNFSTQIGASAATTAVAARSFAIRSAVPAESPSELREADHPPPGSLVLNRE